MKKVYRKLVSMLLAAVLIIACVPATALGEEGNTGAAKNVSESNNGKYMVYYDSWEAYGHPDSGSVKVGDQPLKDSTEYTFVSGDSIEFELQSPAEVSGNTPVVEIVVWNNDKEEIFSSKSNDANKFRNYRGKSGLERFIHTKDDELF